MKNGDNDAYRTQYRGTPKIGPWELDFNYLRKAKVIDMTTTGFSKYRELIQSLNQRVVLIEKAVEFLRSYQID